MSKIDQFIDQAIDWGGTSVAGFLVGWWVAQQKIAQYLDRLPNFRNATEEWKHRIDE